MSERDGSGSSRKEKRRLQRTQIKAERYSPRALKRGLILGTIAVSLAILAVVGIYYSQPEPMQSFSNPQQFINEPQNILTDTSETYYRFGATPPRVIFMASSQPLEEEYLQNLVSNLNVDKGDKESRVKAIGENFSLVGYDNGGYASALQIDESGIYLTAAHVVEDKSGKPIIGKIFVDTPNKDPQAYQILSIVADHDNDLAIFYAPTGKERKPVDNIQIVENIKPKQDTWIIGTVNRYQDFSYVGVLRGIYNPGLKYNKEFATLLPIENLRPFGGLSGGPAIDSEGRLIGVLSGTLWRGNAPTDRKDYKGAAVASIKYLQDLLKKPIQNIGNSG